MAAENLWDQTGSIENAVAGHPGVLRRPHRDRLADNGTVSGTPGVIKGTLGSWKGTLGGRKGTLGSWKGTLGVFKGTLGS